jgi:hypothetical protein
LSGIITNLTGKSAEEFAKEYLFTPLGISEEEYYWWGDDKNISNAGYGFACSPKVQAKLGTLCLNNGNWNGTQIVSEDYMKDATIIQNNNDYGYLFWMIIRPFEGYVAMGAGGQCIYVLPEYNITVGFTASNGPEWLYEQMIFDYILQFVDNRAPEWDEIPEDQTILEGESFFYDVNASHTLGVVYSINDTFRFNISPEGKITNSSNLSAGVYPLEIRALNPFNNTTTATINITVTPKPSSNVIPGFNLNMISLMILCATAVLIIRRKKPTLKIK